MQHNKKKLSEKNVCNKNSEELLSFISTVSAHLLSPVWLFATLCTVVHQASLFMGILQARILE